MVGVRFIIERREDLQEISYTIRIFVINVIVLKIFTKCFFFQLWGGFDWSKGGEEEVEDLQEIEIFPATSPFYLQQ